MWEERHEVRLGPGGDQWGTRRGGAGSQGDSPEDPLPGEDPGKGLLMMDKPGRATTGGQCTLCI